MSGIFSVPFVAFGVFASSDYAKAIWFSMARLAIVLTVYWTWAVERALLVEAEGKLTPKFKVKCGKGVDGCMKENSWTVRNAAGMGVAHSKVMFYRVAVEADGMSEVRGCKGTLTRITKDGAPKWGGDNATLTFAPGESGDAESKTIKNKRVEYLDILSLVELGNEIRIATKGRLWPYPLHPNAIFSEPGKYDLTVVISGDDTPSLTLNLGFIWTGTWNQSELSLLSVG